MNRLLTCFFSAALFTAAATLQAQPQSTPLGDIERDYSGRADTLEYVLVNQFLNSSKGIFYAIPRSYSGYEEATQYIYWQQAHALDVIIYAYERIKDTGDRRINNYERLMQFWFDNHANNWYQKEGDETGFYNEYTDDMCWIGLTMIHLSDALEDDTFANMARKIFDEYILPRGSRDSKGFFSLPWKDDGSGPNACTNSPGCLLAAKLYLRYGDESYLQVAKDLYDWEANVMTTEFNNDGRVEDPALTYTQGTFGEAARQLYHITGNPDYMSMAGRVLYYAISSSSCNYKGLLRDEGSSMDQSIFKAVLIPYLVNYILDEEGPSYYRKRMVTLLQKNANALWDNLDLKAYPRTFCNYYWGEPFDNSKVPSMGAMVSGASLMENTARMALALLNAADVTGVSNVEKEADDAPAAIFNASGQTLQKMQRGLNIVKQTDGRTVKVFKK